MRPIVGALILIPLFVACRPSRESLSAGHIGCLPSEVTISNEESSFGLDQSSATWVAECEGRMYVCTETIARNSPDSEVSCKENGESESRFANEAPPSKPGSTESAKRAGPPSGGAGFELGATAEASQKACEAGGNTWETSGTRGTCSGAATKLGFEVVVELDLCGERVCKINIVHQPTSGWITALDELKKKLVDKYGDPKDVGTNVGTSVPKNCRSEEQLLACFDKGLRLHFKWSWTTGETLRLSAGKPEKSDGPAALRLEYARPAGALGADSSAL